MKQLILVILLAITSVFVNAQVNKTGDGSNQVLINRPPTDLNKPIAQLLVQKKPDGRYKLCELEHGYTAHAIIKAGILKDILLLNGDGNPVPVTTTTEPKAPKHPIPKGTIQVSCDVKKCTIDPKTKLVICVTSPCEPHQE